jgi:vacuolar-type H+-ATPase subunit I/STV1
MNKRPFWLFFGWGLAGAMYAVILVALLANLMMPHGGGNGGDGILIIAAWGFSIPIGIFVGIFFATLIWKGRKIKDDKSHLF